MTDRWVGEVACWEEEEEEFSSWSGLLLLLLLLLLLTCHRQITDTDTPERQVGSSLSLFLSLSTWHQVTDFTFHIDPIQIRRGPGIHLYPFNHSTRYVQQLLKNKRGASFLYKKKKKKKKRNMISINMAIGCSDRPYTHFIRRGSWFLGLFLHCPVLANLIPTIATDTGGAVDWVLRSAEYRKWPSQIKSRIEELKERNR